MMNNKNKSDYYKKFNKNQNNQLSKFNSQRWRKKNLKQL